MVSEEFAKPKVVAGGRFIEFTEALRHKKLFLSPGIILGVEENETDGGSCLFLALPSPPSLVEQECVEIIAVLVEAGKAKGGVT